MITLSALPQIPTDLQKKVIAVVLYGAGDGSSIKSPLGEKALVNCAPGDFVSHAFLLKSISEER
jgi:hypothetical protein